MNIHARSQMMQKVIKNAAIDNQANNLDAWCFGFNPTKLVRDYPDMVIYATKISILPPQKDRYGSED